MAHRALAVEHGGAGGDEPVEALGERLSLPPNFEAMRDELERILTPLPNPRVKT